MNRDNPYVGPQALFEGTSIYGRTSEIEDVIDLLVSSRIVLLYSPSGAGKTSLIQAGLLKALRNELRFSVSFIRGFGGGCNAGNPYLANLYEVLESPLPAERRRCKTLQSAFPCLDEYLRNRPVVMQEGPQSARDRRSAESVLAFPEFDDSQEDRQGDPETPTGHILIFDQFEEVFTLDPLDRDAKAEFFREVGHALLDRTRCALFSMREDHIAELDDYLHFLPTQLKARYRLGLLDRGHAREAIEGPARENGVEYESGAADMLVDELRKVRRQTENGNYEELCGNFVEPVQLQVVCYRLWEHLYSPGGQGGLPASPGVVDGPQSVDPDTVISQTEVRGLSVDSALEQFYDDKVKAAALATDTAEHDIRLWFERELITSHGIRGQVLWEPEKSGGLSNEVITFLENAHLVRVEARGGRKWYELAHDRLVAPIRASNTAWRNHLSLLQRETLEWEFGNRRQDFFLPPIALVNAWLWARANRNTVRPSELVFLRHSFRSILGSRPVVLYLLTVLGIVIIITAVIAVKQLELKDSEARLKVSSATYGARVDAMQRSMDRALISTAKAVGEYQHLDQEKARNALAPAVRETLFTVLRGATDIRHIFVAGNARPKAIAFLSSGSAPLLAYGSEEGAIVLMKTDGVSSKRLENPCNERETKRRTVQSLAFDSRGTLLAAGCQNGDVVVYARDGLQDGTIPEWREASRWRAHENTFTVAFNRSGTQVASGGYRPEIKVMPISGDGTRLPGEPAELKLARRSEKDPVATILSLAFSPAEDKLVAGDSRTYLWLCDTEHTRRCLPADVRAPADVRRAPDSQDRTLAIAFTPDGRHIATGHSSGRLLMWDVTSVIENQQPVIIPRPGPVHSVAIYYKKEDGDKPDMPYVAYGADGLRQTVLIPLPEQRQGQWQRPIISQDEVNAVAFHAPTGLLAAATRSGYIAITEPGKSASHVASVYPLASARSRACPGESGSRNELHPRAVIGDAGSVTRLVISSCGSLQIVDIRKDLPGQLLVRQTIPAERVGQGRIDRIVASASAHRVATLGQDHTVKFWRLDRELAEDSTLPPLTVAMPGAANFRTAGCDLKPRDSAPEKIQELALSPDGDRLVLTFSGIGMPMFVDLRENGRQVSRPVPLCGPGFARVSAFAFNADGSAIAVAGTLPGHSEPTPDHVIVWDLNGATPVARGSSMELSMPAEKVHDVAMMKDASSRELVLAGTSQGQIVLWDAATGQRVNTLNPDTADAISELAVASAQQMFAATDSRGKVTVWDLRSLEMLVLTSRSEPLRKAQLLGFGHGGNSLISIGDELTVWDLDIASLRNKVCRILGQGTDDNTLNVPAEVREACN